VSTQAERAAARRNRQRRAASKAASGDQRPRTGAKKAVADTLAQLPNFLRLLYGLITDPRVNGVDKLLVGAAIAYILMPLDMMPDFIPFFGEVDDVFVLVMSLKRLIANAGRAVALDHWNGDPKSLDSLNLQHTLMAAAFFLPRRVRRRLRAIGRPL
jgi:uncharacterized membrane protein YkvA (DUF1232 family)